MRIISSTRLLTFIVLPFVLALTGSADKIATDSPRPGRAYYVDFLSGNDTNTGTRPNAAWKTLEKVNSTTFAPGDRILFKSGSVWNGQLWPKGSGSEPQPILIDKYGGVAKPIINAGGVEDAVLLKNQEYWEIQNLEITNTGAGPAVRRGVHVAVENYGEAHHIYLRGLTIHDVNGLDSDEIKYNGGINYTCVGNSKPSRFVDLRIENNRIYHVDRSGIFGWSTHWVRSKWYPSLGVIIRNNRLDDIGGDGIVVVATDGALVEYNVVSRANQRSKGFNVAIWPWSADNTLVQYNEAYLTKGHRDSEGFDSDWNSRNTIIQYNYSHDNEGGFLLICNDGSQGPAVSAGNEGTIVRYNISQNDHTLVISLAGPVKNSTIYNNTFYVGKNEKVSLLLHVDWNGWADGTYFYNNVFYVAGEARFAYGVSRNANGAYETAEGFGQSRNNVFDFNTYFGIKPAEDPHALVTDPMLAAPGTGGVGRKTLGGYGPRPASSVINSGKLVDAHAKSDFFERDVPSCGGIDRGAVENQNCVTVDPKSSAR